MPSQILSVDFVDEFEGVLLAFSLASVRKSRDSYSAATVRNVDTLWVASQCYGYTELLDGVEKELILGVSIE